MIGLVSGFVLNDLIYLLSSRIINYLKAYDFNSIATPIRPLIIVPIELSWRMIGVK